MASSRLLVGSQLVQCQGLQHFMRLVQNGAAGGLIYTAALHAYQTVLNNIQQTDAVLAAQLVELFHQGQGLISTPSMAVGSPFSK